MVRWVLKRRIPIAGVLVALILAGVWALVFQPFAGVIPSGAVEIPLTPQGTIVPAAMVRTPLATGVVGTPAVAASPPSAHAAGTIKVYIVGAVAHPGVYDLHDGDRIEDAVRRAGGAMADADLEAVN